MKKEEAIQKMINEKRWRLPDDVFSDAGYESPIKQILSDWQMTMEENVMKAVRNVGIYVDKEELVKALKYDREQYSKGFHDGSESSMRDAMIEIKAERRLLLSWLSKFARHIDMPDHLSDEEAKKLWSKKMAEQFGWECDDDDT